MNTPLDIVASGLYAPKRVDAFLADKLQGTFSRTELKAALVASTILLNGKPARPRDLVNNGDRIQGEVVTAEKWPMTGEDIPLKVLFEDASLMVIDKPVGLVVHPGAQNKTGTLVHALLGRKGPLSSIGGELRPGIVHRLDKDTSGILLVAKNNAAHRALQVQFSTRTMNKTYLALVKGRVEFEEGHVNASLARDPKDRQKVAVSRSEMARPAETLYRVLKRYRYATLLELKLITGRTHQIRVHMLSLGHPVVGDVLYGGPQDLQCPRMALHASKIEFLHPKTDKLMSFESPIPPEMKAMIEKAEGE